MLLENYFVYIFLSGAEKAKIVLDLFGFNSKSLGKEWQNDIGGSVFKLSLGRHPQKKMTLTLCSIDLFEENFKELIYFSFLLGIKSGLVIKRINCFPLRCLFIFPCDKHYIYFANFRKL